MYTMEYNSLDTIVLATPYIDTCSFEIIIQGISLDIILQTSSCTNTLNIIDMIHQTFR